MTGWTVRVLAGPGLVARSGAGVLVVLPAGSAHQEVCDRVLGLVTGAGADAAGRPLIRSLARVVSDADPGQVPPLAVLTEADGVLAVLVLGQVAAHVVSGRTDVLSGARSAAWLDRTYDASSVHRVVVLPARRRSPAIDDRLDLRSGVVPGGGVSLDRVAVLPEREPQPDTGVMPRLSAGPRGRRAAHGPAARPARRAGVPPRAGRAGARQAPAGEPPGPVPRPEPGPEPAPKSAPAGLQAEPAPEAAAPTGPAAGEHPGFIVIPLDPIPEEQLSPLPVLGPDSPPTTPPGPVAADGHSVQVEGVLCKDGHFGRPGVPYCGQCGLAMVHRTHNLVVGPRPALGVLVVDDGAAHQLDRDYILGREPGNDAAVKDGRARPLTLDDDTRKISRVHARIVLDAWDVFVEDAGSVNGTRVDQSGTGWAEVAPGERLRLRSGARIRLGDRVVVFESALRGAEG